MGQRDVNPWFEQILGLVTQNLRAGDRHLAWNDTAVADAPTTLRLTSTAFNDGMAIPRRHAGSGLGDNRSPALAWHTLPRGTKALVLIVEDPDAPLPRPFVHALAWWATTPQRSLPEGALSAAAEAVKMGRNDFGHVDYQGPAPPPFHGPHRYIFQLFALSRPPKLERGATRSALLDAMRDAVLARGRLDGTFQR